MKDATSPLLEFSRHKFLYLTIAASVFGLFFAVAFFSTPPEWAQLDSFVPNTERALYEPEYELQRGGELAFVYIGSSTCGWCNVEDLPRLIKQSKLHVKDEAQTDSLQFSATGIAKDWKVKDGVAHLEKFGRFDEIMAGKSWLNSGLRRYVWGELAGDASTPQVLVLERYLDVPASASETVAFSVEDERRLVKKTGVASIRNWLQDGAPVPKSSFAR
jgi:hypothetical protein